MQQDRQIALVTGANQGIGLQIARDLAAQGMVVLLGARDLAKGEVAAAGIAGDVHPIRIDVTDSATIRAAADRIAAEYGRLDALVNNAAISNTAAPGTTLAEYAVANRASLIPVEEVRAIWDTNVFGVLELTQAMIPLLRASDDARIVNVSSGMGSLTASSDPDAFWRGMFNPGYAASKTALNAITLAFAIELESEGIRVHAVSPGFTRTALNNYEGTETLEQGAAEAVRVTLLPKGSPTGTFTMTQGSIPW